MDAPAAVELQLVTKSYGSHRAVENLSLAVPTNTIYGFIGPNGSGKSTTLRMIMRILRPDSGTIRVLGTDSLSSASDRIGYLPEERGLYRQMKVRDLLRFYAGLKGVRSPDPLISLWLERLGLAAWATRKIGALSKGMAQKIQFIATVLHSPQLIILDEPFSGLDPINSDLFRQTVLDLKRDGATIIFSTHDMSVAQQMCDSIFMIYKGKKVLDGRLDTIQQTYGQDTLRVRIDPTPTNLAALPGVVKVTDFGRYQELRLAHGTNPQSILPLLANLGNILLFELAHPSLHDIFLRIAGPDATVPNSA